MMAFNVPSIILTFQVIVIKFFGHIHSSYTGGRNKSGPVGFYIGYFGIGNGFFGRNGSQ